MEKREKEREKKKREKTKRRRGYTRPFRLVSIPKKKISHTGSFGDRRRKWGRVRGGNATKTAEQSIILLP